MPALGKVQLCTWKGHSCGRQLLDDSRRKAASFEGKAGGNRATRTELSVFFASAVLHTDSC